MMLGQLLISVYLSWAHSGQIGIDGFHIWRGPSPDKMVVIATVPDKDAKSWISEWKDLSSPQYYGVTAYNALGDSTITTKDEGGRSVVLGKPESPTVLQWSVK